MSLAQESQAIEERVSLLEERVTKIRLLDKYDNLQKAWDKSFVKIVFTASTTYAVAVLSMLIIDIEQPFLNAAVPALLYVLSFQSLPFVKRSWMRYYLAKQAREKKKEKEQNDDPRIPEARK